MFVCVCVCECVCVCVCVCEREREREKSDRASERDLNFDIPECRVNLFRVVKS